jgi:hypothetical protein
MITIEALTNAGYSEYKPHKGDRLFQKWFTFPRSLGIESARGKLYALNFYVWIDSQTQISAEARLYQNPHLHGALTHGLPGEPETSFDLVLHVGDAATVESVESFFHRAFAALDCIPDPHN